MVRLLETYGFDIILVETAGAGQGDTAVRALADVVVLLLQPETGDDLQWEKAGVLEVADIIVIHKADLPGADQTAAQVRAALDLSIQREIPVVRVSSKEGADHEELWKLIESTPVRRDGKNAAHELLLLTQDELAARWTVISASPQFAAILNGWRDGTSSIRDTAD